MAKKTQRFSHDEFAFASKAIAAFHHKLYFAEDNRPFRSPCLGVGADVLCLRSKFRLSQAVLGHVDLSHVPELTSMRLAIALTTTAPDTWAALAGALLNARDIKRNGVNDANEYGFNMSMTMLEDLLRAHFAD